MFVPLILPRMEQQDNCASDRINARKVGAFVTVAEDATQVEIPAVGWAAMFLGDDVIDLEVEAGEPFRKVTVLTAKRGSLTDEFNELPLHTALNGGI